MSTFFIPHHYIGRFSFRHGYELLILDWRAPISGMFYDYEIGPAGFDAPSGRIEGYLAKKRQFGIKNGVLEYALETSANIQDDVLQKELSHTSSEKMKTIISTIQKEQNRIIRDEETETLIIQGAAGSGKTSIAQGQSNIEKADFHAFCEKYSCTIQRFLQKSGSTGNAGAASKKHSGMA